MAIHDLFERIREIKNKANTSEHMVQEITRDIKQLGNWLWGVRVRVRVRDAVYVRWCMR